MLNTSARTDSPKGTVTVIFTDIVGSTALRDAMVAEHGEEGTSATARRAAIRTMNGSARCSRSKTDSK